MADDDGFKLFIYSIIGFFAGLFFFYKGFIWLKEKRMIENVPTSKIRSIAMGLVEVTGEVVTAEKNILKSPFSLRDCVYYRYSIEEYRSSGKHSSWQTVKSGERCGYFYLKDDTGRVFVEPKGAEIDLKPKFTYTTSSSLFGKKTPLPGGVQQFMVSNKMNSYFGRKMRYTEYSIEPKDKLYIMGTADDNPFVEDGTAVEGVQDVMLHKGENEKFYYISDKSERDVLKSLGWKVFGGIFGGAALTVACLAYILFYVGLL